MASRVRPVGTRVLEIGAGTGAITQAVLDRGISPECLIVIERDPELAAFLHRRFPRVHVVRAHAIDCGRVLSDCGIPKVETVVSSLPLRNLSARDRNENVQAMLDALTAEGQLVQYTYGNHCPIPCRRFRLQAERLGRVWQNLPPAAVWRFTRRA